MNNTTPQMLTVQVDVNAPVQTAWDCYNLPEHITKWNFASPDWHCTAAESDFQVGGKFSSRMEAKDGSFGFDFWGIYDLIIPNEKIAYTLGDDRKAEINFTANGEGTQVLVQFEPEGTNPLELQQGGWQAILNNYKSYTESL